MAGCALVAVVAAILPALLQDISHTYLPVFLQVAVGWTPEGAALVAVVLTRVRWVGLAIALAAAVIGVSVGVLPHLVVLSYLWSSDFLSWFAWGLSFPLALLAADLLARRVTGFTVRTGALAGVLVAMAAAVLQGLRLVNQTGFDGLQRLPTEYWITRYAAPLLALVLIAAVAGAVAERRTLSAAAVRAHHEPADPPTAPVA